MAMSSGVDHFAAGAVRAYLATVVERLETNALALVRLRVEEHHVGDVDGSLALDDAARLVDLRVWLRVALDEVDVLHENAVSRDAHHFALLAFVFAGDHDDLITFADTVHGVNPKKYICIDL